PIRAASVPRPRLLALPPPRVLRRGGRPPSGGDPPPPPLRGRGGFGAPTRRLAPRREPPLGRYSGGGPPGAPAVGGDQTRRHASHGLRSPAAGSVCHLRLAVPRLLASPDS